MLPEQWPGISQRLLKFIFHSGIVFGYRWSEQCAHWIVITVKHKDVYRNLK